MEIKLNVYCREDLEMQCYAILKQLEAGRSLEEIKDYIGGRNQGEVKNEDSNLFNTNNKYKTRPR